MPLNPSKGKMFKSVGWTWNPVSGCTHECEYCWAAKFAAKYKRSFEPIFREKYLKDKFPNDDSWIFVGSTGDMFCSGMDDEWVLKIIGRIAQEEGNNKFLLQTKNPFSFMAFYLELEKIKDKIILGTTIETTGDTTKFSKAPSTIERYTYLRKMKQAGFKTFLSLEPLADFDFNELIRWIVAIDPEAVEIGLENYSSHTVKPNEKKIKALIYNLDVLEIPYVLKENLRHLE